MVIHILWSVSFTTKPDDAEKLFDPDVVYQDVDPLGAYLRTQDLCYRWGYFGAPFTGLTWSCVNVPRYNYVSYIQMEKVLTGPGVCTNRDAGYQPSF